MAFFDVEVSTNGTDWTTVSSGQSSGASLEQEMITFGPVAARYVRYVGHQNSVSSWNSLTEVDIYNNETSPATVLLVAASAGDQVYYVGLSLGNLPPLVDAGDDQVVVLSADTGEAVANLDGSVTDDGLPDPPASVATEWHLVDGPATGTVTFDDVSAPMTTARFDTVGTHVLRLDADDDELLASDEVSINVIEDGGGVSIIHEETLTGGSTSASSVSTAGDLSGVNGDLYLAAIATKSHVAVTEVSGLGLLWEPVREQCAGRNQTGVTVWMALGVPSGDGQVTATLAGTPSNAVIAVSRYSGVDVVNPVGGIVSGNTNGTNGGCSGGTDSNNYAFDLSTLVNGSVVYGVAAIRNRSHIPGIDFEEQVEAAQGSDGSTAGIAVQDQTVALASLTTVDGAFSRAVDWAVIGVVLK